MTVNSYAESGVDVASEEPALAKLKQWVGQTAQFRPELVGLLGLASFANVIDIGGGRGIALSTDGVGTKLLVSQIADRYDTIGIDCVAMNVNDVVAVGAEPVTMLDYLAIEEPDERMFEALGKGLFEGAKQAGVAIVGGETSQIAEVIKGVRPGRGFDLVGMCVGTVDLDRVIDGSRIEPGDVVIGLPSSGVHSNGLSLARKVLLPDGGDTGEVVEEFGRSAVAELLEPTRIYVRQAMALVNDPEVDVRGMAHITGDGLMNLTRVAAEVGFVLDDLPEPQAVFRQIQQRGGISDVEMYTVFNMGVGFCVVVPEVDVARALKVLACHSEMGVVMGRAQADPQRAIHLPGQGLVGVGRHFAKS